MKQIQVKHDLGKRLYGGQGQHKIGGAHLGHMLALQCMHDNFLNRHSLAERCTQSGTYQ